MIKTFKIFEEDITGMTYSWGDEKKPMKSFILRDIYKECDENIKTTLTRLKELLIGKTIKIEELVAGFNNKGKKYYDVNDWSVDDLVTNIKSGKDKYDIWFELNGEFELMMDDKITFVEPKKYEPTKEIPNDEKWWEHGRK